jgi:SAM-dependent methyltransferase
MNHPQDHFSALAQEYARGRLVYPEQLYRFLTAQCRHRNLVWDCATGSGQAALDLVKTFARVIATDISKELLALAPPHERISYREASAETSGIETNAADLVTVAQAIHWFDLPKFWPELLRVLRTGGVFAFWGYNWPVVDSDIDRVQGKFREAIFSSWPKRSAILHEGYTSVIPPPSLVEITSPNLELSAQWSLSDYILHLRSWSATRYYKENHGDDIVDIFSPAFREAWHEDRVNVRWSLILRVFQKT